MDNLLSSTDIGTIFLDRELSIRKFTPQIAETFNLLPQDVGRPIETLRAQACDHPELVDDLERVLATRRAGRARAPRRATAARSSCASCPTAPRATIDGVVLTLIDVSGLKAAEDALFHERYLLNSLLASVPDAIYFKDARGRFIRANHAMAARLGLDGSRARPSARRAFELARPARPRSALHQQDEAVLRTGEAQHYKLEQRARAGRRRGVGPGHAACRCATRTSAIVGIIGDLPRRHRAEARRGEDPGAVRRRDQFLAMLSHELRNPLGAIVTATALLKTSGPPRGRRSASSTILERQSQQMARLLDDLLEASRVTQNKIELKQARRRSARGRAATRPTPCAS